MAKESLIWVLKDPIWRDTFIDEQTTRRNWGVPTSVITYANGKANFPVSDNSNIPYKWVKLVPPYTLRMVARRWSLKSEPRYSVLFWLQATYWSLAVYADWDLAYVSTGGSVPIRSASKRTDEVGYHDIVMTVDGVGASWINVNIYFDWVLAETSSNSPWYITTHFAVGNFSNGTQVNWTPFRGDIELAEAYDYVLTAWEISSLYNNRYYSEAPISWLVTSIDCRSWFGRWSYRHTATNTNVTPANDMGKCAWFNWTSSLSSLWDSDTFSFGNGVTSDQPFSLLAIVKIDSDTTDSHFIGKYESWWSEYMMGVAGWDFILRIYDESSSAYKQRKLTGGISSYLNQWMIVIGTYDGSRDALGLEMYINGSAITNQSNTVWIYSSMDPTAWALTIGGNTWLSWYLDGKIKLGQLYNKELSTAEIATLQNIYAPLLVG